MSSSRNQYDSDEDKLLIKYLAKYNPGVQGRKGNKVYQTLVNNSEGKWAWSRGHSWSGWRDRYVKHQDEFDRRIRKYQERHKLPTENSNYIIGSKKTVDSDVESDANDGHKRKRASALDPRKRAKVVREEEEEESEGVEYTVGKISQNGRASAASSSRESPTIRKIYPSLKDLSGPARPKPKLIVRRDSNEDDPFEAETASRPPTTASNVSSDNGDDEDQPPKPRKLRRLNESNAFRNGASAKPTRKTVIQSSDSDDAEPLPWPPPRPAQKNNTAPAPFKVGPPIGLQKPVRREKTPVFSPKKASQPKPAEQPRLESRKTPRRDEADERPKTTVFRRVAPQVNAVASSSRVQLPSASEPPSTPNGRSPTKNATPQHSPLDWGSPTGGLLSDPAHSPLFPTSPPTSPSRRPDFKPESPFKFDFTSLLEPEDDAAEIIPARPKRNPLRNSVAPRQAPQPLFFAVPRAMTDGNSEYSVIRRSRAPSPNTDTPRNQLASPPRVRQRHRTPPSSQSKRRVSEPFREVFVSADSRRRSVPASGSIARVDFNKKRILRQSLPPPALLREHPREQRRVSAPQLHREGSIFSFRSPWPSASLAASLQGSPSDLALAADIGAQTLLGMAQNHGFGIDIVKNLFARTRDLARTDAVLLKMRQTAEAAGEAMLEVEEEEHREGVAQSSPQNHVHVQSHRRHVSGVRTPPSQSAARSTSESRKRRSAGGREEVFRPTPLRIDPQDALADTDYTPPSGSRAAALARAARRGLSMGTTNVAEREPLPVVNLDDILDRDLSGLRQLERRDVELALDKAHSFAAFVLRRSGMK
uniref:TERF2-interacting telomeric protein 1 Myb domain-containing protein n=1 Tax=Mycena chlorophos TaxID=658473 RepID=A0ABQ0LFM6_MYCCL|nr:predicted protein [Mycena chlorophos]